jgi:hypothetical protein
MLGKMLVILHVPVSEGVEYTYLSMTESSVRVLLERV